MIDEYALAQAQISGIFIEAALKEYAADWREGSENKTVVRDSATGQFAKKATSVTESVKDAATTIQEAIKDPKEAKRKVNSELLKLTAKGLDKLVEKNPEFADELLNKMFGVDAQTARDRLADKYAKVNPGLPNAIKPDPLKEIVNSISGLQEGRDPKELAKDIKRAFELAGFKYNKLIDDLNNVESESEGIKVLGKIAAASIPIAGYLAATLTPEIAIGMLVGDTLGTILVSAAATQAVSFAANKAMDKMDVKNPWVRLGIDLAIGIGVGSGVSAGAKQLEKKALLKAAKAKQAKELAEAEAKAAQKLQRRQQRLNNIKDENAKQTLQIAEAHITTKEADLYDKFVSMGVDSKLLDSVITKTQSIIEESKIAIRVPDLNVFDLIKNSRFKSTFETATRDNVDYMSWRNEVEKLALGITEETTEDASRPIYGYVVDGKDHVSGTYKGEGKATDGYGLISVILKDDVKTSASFSATDSFQRPNSSLMEKSGLGAFFQYESENLEVINETLEKISKAETVEDLVQLGSIGVKDKKPRYLETQIFGKVNGSDIAEVVINDRVFSRGADPELAKKLFGSNSVAGFAEELEKEGIKVHVPEESLELRYAKSKGETPTLKSMSNIEDYDYNNGRIAMQQKQVHENMKITAEEKRQYKTNSFIYSRHAILESVAQNLNVFRYLERIDQTNIVTGETTRLFSLKPEFDKEVLDAIVKHDPNFFSDFEKSWGLPIDLGL